MSVAGGALVLAAGLGMLAATGALLACLLRLRSAVSFVLAAYLIAWGALVAVSFGLSAGEWLERWTLVAAFLAVSLVALAVWLARGRPAPPSLRPAARNALAAAADPLVAVPLLASALALAYALVVTFTTAPNDGDPLAYELTRAAFWRQEHGIGLLEAAHDERLNFSPPVAETGDLAILTLSGQDRFAGLTQWLAVLALALGTYGVGRRIGLERRAALWGASLVPLFPVVLMQSWTSFTDLVFGSFAVSAVYFGLGSAGAELVVLALAVGLAMGTKFLGPVFAPLFLLILGLAQPVRRWPWVAAAAASGAVIAGLWYLRTIFEEGEPVGNEGAGLQSREIAPVVTTFARLSAELFDLSGAPGKDARLYWVVALGLGAAAVARLARRQPHAASLGAAAVLVAATPWVVEAVGEVYARFGVGVGDALGRADLVEPLRDWEASRIADGAYSWYGPLGAVLAIAGLPIAIREVRRKRLSRVALALGAAPLLAIGLVSVTIVYERFEGRYFVSALALGAATWGGFALRHRWLATTAVGIAIATALLSLVNSLGKPSGIALFRGDPGRSVWSMPNWEQQGILRSTPPERDEVMTMRFVEERVPEDASVGVTLAHNSFGFPYFGRELGRTVTLVADGATVPEQVDWLVSAPELAATGCVDSWALGRRGTHGWLVWRRVAPDDCASAAPLRSS